MEGIINALKPPGMTSHDVVSFLRRTLGEKKIGHCGTLDPQAAGVLPVCIGQATRLADYLSGGEKSYYCEMELGYETDTQDIWGAVTWVCPDDAPDPLAAPCRLAEAVRSLEGTIQQEVPAYSSVKREGKSLHQYAREGKPQTGIARSVLVRSIQLLGGGSPPATASTAEEGGWRRRRLRFIVECGSGTYVRMICRDIGRKLGCGGAMSFLLRLGVGPFRLEDSITLEEILLHKDDVEARGGIVAPKELALAHMPRIAASGQEAAKLRQGQALWLTANGLAPNGGAQAGNRGGGARDGSLGGAPGSVYGSLPHNNQLCGAHRAWVADEGNLLVALGSYKLGRDARSGQVFFKPDKVFGASTL